MRPYDIKGFLQVISAVSHKTGTDSSFSVTLTLKNISSLPLTDVAVLPCVSGGCAAAEELTISALQPGEAKALYVTFSPGDDLSASKQGGAEDWKAHLTEIPCRGTYVLELDTPTGPLELTLEASCVRPITQKDLQDAVVQTAWAYYFKQERVQYDSALTTAIRDKNYCVYRNTEGRPPEYATDHTTHFSVCTYFCYDSYFNTFGGYRLGGGKDAAFVRTHQMWKHIDPADSTVVLRWSSLPGEVFTNVPENVTNGAELADWLKEDDRWYRMLQPGDVIVNTGHATMYIGNGILLECWGSKYAAITGTELYEDHGAIAINGFAGYYLDPASNTGFNYFSGNKFSCTKVLILRPTNQMVDANGIYTPQCGWAMDGSALARLYYPAMEIDRTVELTPYGTAVEGDCVTYRVRISNRSNSSLHNINKCGTLSDGTRTDYPHWHARHWNMPGYAGEDYRRLPVTQIVSAGNTVEEISHGGRLDEKGRIAWVLDLKAGETVTLSYRVRVRQKRGSVLVSEGGCVGGIADSPLSNRVGGKPLPEEAKAGIGDYYRYARQYTHLLQEKGVANGIYEGIFGRKLELPSVKSLVHSLFAEQSVCSGPDQTMPMWMCRANNPEDPVRRMLVDRFFGGYRVHSVQAENQRIWDLNPAYYAVGDVLVKVYDAETGEGQVLVYLGQETFATLDEDGLAVSVCAASIWKDIFKTAYQLFFLLRPSQAYADLNAQLEKVAPFVPDPNFREPEETVATGTLSDWQRAVVETALAYWRCRAWAVLDNQPLTPLGDAGPLRTTWNVAPEEITEDERYFGISPYLIYEIYQNALGIRLAENQQGMLDAAFLQDRYAEAELPLQPADILLLQDGGMALSLGADQFLTMAAGEEAIVICENLPYLAALRPLTADCGAALTASAAGRLAYPGLEIHMDSGACGRSKTVREGDAVPYIVTVTNHSDNPYHGIEICWKIPGKGIYENLPENHSDGSGVFCYLPEENLLKWKVDVPSGESVSVSCRIRCKKNLVNVGMHYLYYLMAEGSVGKTGARVPLKKQQNRIGLKPLTEDMLSVLSGLTDDTLGTFRTDFENKRGTHGARHVLRCMEVSFVDGIHKGFPGIGACIGIKQRKDASIGTELDPESGRYGYGVLRDVDEPGGFVRGRQMMVEGYYGGSLVWSEQGSRDRVRDPSLEDLEPGDIIMAYFGKTSGSSLAARYWVYQGKNAGGVYRLVDCDPDEKGAPPKIVEYTNPKTFFAVHHMQTAFDPQLTDAQCCAAFLVVRMSQVENMVAGPAEPDRME